MGVELMNVQRVASLVHVGVVTLSLVVAVDLNGLSAVAFLSVQLASAIGTDVNWLDEESLVVATSCVRWVARHASSLLADHSLAGRVEAEVGLGHQLLIKRGINTSVGVEVASVVHLLLSRALATSLEKLRENRFLLLVHVAVAIVDLKALALD